MDGNAVTMPQHAKLFECLDGLDRRWWQGWELLHESSSIAIDADVPQGWRRWHGDDAALGTQGRTVAPPRNRCTTEVHREASCVEHGLHDVRVREVCGVTDGVHRRAHR